MKPARYVGRRGGLKNETALLRHATHVGRHGEPRVFVQLDRMTNEDGEQNPLAFGWHDFAADQWEEIK